jgi:hypothetical protein
MQKNFLSIASIQKTLPQDFVNRPLLPEIPSCRGNCGIEQKRTKPGLYLICLCIVIRCIMDIKDFFVNTLSDIGTLRDNLHSCDGIELSSWQSHWTTKGSSFHCRPSPVDTFKHQAAVLSTQTKTILQTYIHLGRAWYVGDIVQITVRVRGFIIYGWVDDPLVHY